MTKHEKADRIEHLISIFMHIKQISASGGIDLLCLEGMSKLYDLADSEKIQAELDAVRKRRIDPTS